MNEETAELRLRSLRVEHLMNPDVVQVSASSTMEEVAEQLRQHDISSAPVVDEHGTCLGIISASDFLKRDACVSERECSTQPPDDSVASYMTAGVQTIRPETSMLKAALVMCTAHLHHLPVLDDQQRLVGMISTMDITSSLVNAIDEVDGAFLKRHLVEGNK